MSLLIGYASEVLLSLNASDNVRQVRSALGIDCWAKTGLLSNLQLTVLESSFTPIQNVSQLEDINF